MSSRESRLCISRSPVNRFTLINPTLSLWDVAQRANAPMKRRPKNVIYRPRVLHMGKHMFLGMWGWTRGLSGCEQGPVIPLTGSVLLPSLPYGRASYAPPPPTNDMIKVQPSPKPMVILVGRRGERNPSVRGTPAAPGRNCNAGLSPSWAPLYPSISLYSLWGQARGQDLYLTTPPNQENVTWIPWRGWKLWCAFLALRSGHLNV